MMIRWGIGIGILCCMLSCKTQNLSPLPHVYNTQPYNSNLVNTIWKITYMHQEFGKRNFDVVLSENGKVISFNPFDTTPDNDEWEERDGYIFIYFNNRNATYKAILFDEAMLVGTAYSNEGGMWSWLANKYSN